MNSGVLNFWVFGLINNATGGGTSCVTGQNLPGICTPLYNCNSALNDFTLLRSPVYCNRNRYSIVPTVCCPTYKPTPPLTRRPENNYPPINSYPTQRPFPTTPETSPIHTTSPWVNSQITEKTTNNPEAIVFHRLAERKCIKYSDLIYENRSIFDPETSTTQTERVNTCYLRLGPAVIGGQKADATEYPHMALIGYKSSDAEGDEIQWLCGGAIISMRFVLTAAHCIKTSRGSPTHVRIGDLNHKTSTDEAAPQTIPVTDAIPHEQYRAPYVYNDIGLLELAHSIQLSQFARPACLHTESTVLPLVPLIATGWGRTEVNGPSSADLLEVTLEQFSSGDCGQTYKPSKQLPVGVNGDSQICAGSRFEKKDTCKGDSGGPLQIKEQCISTIVGVTSFGRGCGNIGVPGVYTRVSYYIDWIEDRAFVYE